MRNPTGDLIDRTARQVWISDANTTARAVHAIVRTERADAGRVYRTRCNDVFLAVHGATLTTRDVSCSRCQEAD